MPGLLDSVQCRFENWICLFFLPIMFYNEYLQNVHFLHFELSLIHSSALFIFGIYPVRIEWKRKLKHKSSFKNFLSKHEQY